MPNTPCKHSASINARVLASIPNPDSANEVLNDQLQSVLGIERRNWARQPHSKGLSFIYRQTEKGESRCVDMETHVVGVKERRQGTRWMSILVPFSTPNALD
jgi:hypothetical protein